MGQEVSCAYNEECFWEANSNECIPRNSPCDALLSPTYCIHNEQCFWEEFADECLSIWSGCPKITNEVHCELNRGCQWDEKKLLCESLGVETTKPIWINCEDIIDVEVCGTSRATEHDNPCFWDEEHDKCAEFKFDCEDFLTMDTCNEASNDSGSVHCIWEGECNEAPNAGAQAQLESARPLEAGAAEPSPVLKLVSFFCAFVVGSLIGTFLVRRYRFSKRNEELEEAFTFETWTIDEVEEIRVIQ